MAIVLEANYAKKLGLPNYSSHQYSVTIRTELTDLAQVEAESARLYRTLQDAVDREIQEVGFLPDATTYGMNGSATNGNGGSHRNGGNGSAHGQSGANGHGSANGNGSRNGTGHWRCSDKQRDLIERIVRENHLDKRDVESLSVAMFGSEMNQLDRSQASGLIDELFERHSNRSRGQKRPYRREPEYIPGESDE